MRCKYDEKDAVYTCGVCGRLLCAEHAKLRTVCPSHVKKAELAYTIRKVTSEEERSIIRGLVRRFWGEEEQLTLDRKFVVAELPAYVAKVDNGIIGFVSIAETGDAVIVVALGVLPQYQRSGVGSRLIEKVESEARRLRKRKVLVSTSNDDLPALAFYQSLGFQIYEVKPDVVAQKHGVVLRGIGGLPVRDELRLQKILN
jgi:ribosomal protein S18 acetylase RimI-like enzyme